MINLESIYATLDSNPELEDGFKDNLKELVTIFNKFFPNISLENLNNKLKTLKINKTNKFVTKKIFEYNPSTNVLSFNLEDIMKDYDIKHILMHSLLCIMTSHDNTYGFDQNNEFIAINTGYTEILTNFLVGNDRELTLFDEEVIATNLIAELIGNDTMFEAYFSNNPNMIAEAMLNEGDVDFDYTNGTK